MQGRAEGWDFRFHGHAMSRHAFQSTKGMECLIDLKCATEYLALGSACVMEGGKKERLPRFQASTTEVHFHRARRVLR